MESNPCGDFTSTAENPTQQSCCDDDLLSTAHSVRNSSDIGASKRQRTSEEQHQKADVRLMHIVADSDESLEVESDSNESTEPVGAALVPLSTNSKDGKSRFVMKHGSSKNIFEHFICK